MDLIKICDRYWIFNRYLFQHASSLLIPGPSFLWVNPSSLWDVYIALQGPARCLYSHGETCGDQQNVFTFLQGERETQTNGHRLSSGLVIYKTCQYFHCAQEDKVQPFQEAT